MDGKNSRTDFESNMVKDNPNCASQYQVNIDAK